MKFIDREYELETLSSEYARDGSSLVVIYGRRRVGKTSLIMEFIKDKPSIYFLADLQSEFLQIERFKTEIARKLNDSFLSGVRITDWDTLFRYIAQSLPVGKKMVIVIDEFQYLAKVNKAFPSIFQRIWDTILSRKNVMVIICGSLVSMMYNTTLSYRSPLYGRRTSQIKLAPLDFFNYSKFFRKKSANEIFKFYCVTGGIPKYIEVMDTGKGIFENIRENVLNRNSFLYSEPRFVLREEIKDEVSYFSILHIISQGEHKIGKIAGRLGVDTKNLTSFIEKLIEMEILERKVPITEKNPSKSKKGLYFIKDNFFNFWFRYVFPYQSHLEMGEIGFVLKKIKLEFKIFASRIFEDVCIDFLRRNNIPFQIEKIGKWWNKDTEIDIVAFGMDKVLFGECKYQDGKVGTETLNKLVRKSEQIQTKGERFFAIFSKSGFTSELRKKAESKKNILLFTVDDLLF